MSAPRWHSAEDDGTSGVVSCHNGRHLVTREVYDRLTGCPYCSRAGQARPPLASIADELRARAIATDLKNKHPRTVAAAGGMDKRS